MKTYETLFITQPELSVEEAAEMTEKVKGVIEAKGGEVTKVEEWGKKRLAYEISKVHDGYYTLVCFNGNNDVLDELNHIFRITENLLRGIIVKTEE